ncbi:MAG TPA: asparaginase [Gemmatimonadaceae bacterium]|nr:asparaginase [Gemmatimonadaceae bacterium]
MSFSLTSDPSPTPTPVSLPVEPLSLDVVVTRGGLVESRHRVHAAIVRHDGALLAAARDPHLVTWWRSCAKPFQVMPMLEDGTFDALGWGDEELALACASHGSEPEHVAVAARMLAAVGLDESALACGPHEPLSARGAALLREQHAEPGRLHSNCSGKHAAMLARAAGHHWPTAGYHDADHPVQVAIRHMVSAWTDVPEAELGHSVDGCGVPVFALPLHAMALSYARLAEQARRGVAIPARIVRAMTSHPHLVGGTARFDTLLMQAGGGRIIAKIGAEGVHTVGWLDRGLGLALKVEDGSPRAQFPAVLAALQAIGALPAVLPDALLPIASARVTNTRGELTGAVFVPGHEVVA